MANPSDIMKQLQALVGEMGDGDESVPYWLDTGLENLNLALSGDRKKGFAGGRLIVISGPESSGKTALATNAVVAGQKQKGFGFLEDFEHAWHAGHAKSLGVDYSRFADPVQKPSCGEDGFESAYNIIRTIRAVEAGITLPKDTKEKPTAAADAIRKELLGIDKSKLIPIVGIMDSIAAMIPKEQDVAYVNQNMKTKNMAHAMMLSIELKRLARDCFDTATTMFLLNQLRTNPGVMFGDNTTEPGGNPPKFYASTMLRLRRVDKLYREWDDNKSEVIGDIVEVFVRKNKIAKPFVKTRYVFRTADPVGLDPVLTMIYLGKEAGILGAVTGKTIEFGGKKRWNIADAEKEFRSDPKALRELTDFVMTSINPVTQGPVIAEEEDEDPNLASVFAGLTGMGAPAAAE